MCEESLINSETFYKIMSEIFLASSKDEFTELLQIVKDFVSIND